MPLIIAIGAVLLLALIVNWLQDRAEQRRKGRLKDQADAIGFRYSEEGDPRLLNQTAGFLLFAQGVTRQTRNAMLGEQASPPSEGTTGTPGRAAADVAISEYVFSVPAGRFMQNWRQTVVRLSSPSLSLPSFAVMPHAVFDALAAGARDKEMREQLVGSAGIVFNDHPKFKSQSHVMGFDRQQIRNLLSDDLIAFYEAHPSLCTEGGDTTLIFYIFDEMITAEDVPTFLSEALEAYGMLKAESDIDE